MYTSEERKNPKKMVDYVHTTWKRYRDAQIPWFQAAKSDMSFRLGNQWQEDEIEELKKRGHAPIVVNRIHPAVELLKSILISNNPSFRVFPREDSDREISHALSALLEYVFHISDGKHRLRSIIDDYSVCGRGAALVYFDKQADGGKGEVKFKELNIFDVYPDPAAQDWFCDDAEHIIYSRVFTRAQLRTFLKESERIVRKSAATIEEYESVSDLGGTPGIFFPENVEFYSAKPDDEKVRVYEMYSKVRTKRYNVYETFSSMTYDFDEDQLSAYYTQPAFVYNGKVVSPDMAEQIKIEQQRDIIYAEEMIKSVYEEFKLKKSELYVNLLEQIRSLNEALASQTIIYERYSLELDKAYQDYKTALKQLEEQERIELLKFGNTQEVYQVNNYYLMQSGLIQVLEYDTTEIELVSVVGDKLNYIARLPIEHYPIVFIMNLHTKTPYPLSDVRMVKGQQRYLNKMYQLTMAYFTSMATPKILLPRGSIDLETFQYEWSKPNAAVEVDMELGTPIPWSPPQLPNQLFLVENQLKSDIEYQFGIFELMMGNANAAPSTFKATVSIDEFGQRRIRSKQSDLEAFLTRLGTVVLDYCRLLYRTPKLIRILQPNNIVSEFMINSNLVDKYHDGTITHIGDISTYKYDVVVVSGSTMPTNRYAMLEMYERLYAAGVIDQVEFLKKTDVFDIEGVLQRTSHIARLEAMLQQAKEEIDNLKGDLQNKDREIQNLRNKVEVVNFRGELDKIRNTAAATAHIATERLKDEVANLRSKTVNTLQSIANSVKQNQLRSTQGQAKKKGVNNGRK